LLSESKTKLAKEIANFVIWCCRISQIDTNSYFTWANRIGVLSAVNFALMVTSASAGKSTVMVRWWNRCRLKRLNLMNLRQ
jgi:hypothetical protein